MLAYASIYGNTENAAEILASRLRDLGIQVEVFDVSVVPMSEIVAACFRYSHLVFAATTYNAGVFITMEELIHDLVLHNIQNRTLAFIENGSWMPASGKLMRETLAPLKNMTVLEETVSLRSSLKEEQLAEVDAMAKAIANPMVLPKNEDVPMGELDKTSLFAISYGLFVLTAKDGERDNGCIINTVIQATSTPLRVTFTVNKSNLTHDMVLKTGLFNLSILTEQSKFDVYQRFGLKSGKDGDKFADYTAFARSVNGLTYITEGTNVLLSGKVLPSPTTSIIRTSSRNPARRHSRKRAGSAQSAVISTRAKSFRRTSSAPSASMARRCLFRWGLPPRRRNPNRNRSRRR